MTTLTFVLRRGGRVVFTVKQVSPGCVGIGHFTVRAHAGLNRVRFAAAVHRRPLTPGTYRISIRTAAGHVVRRVTLVVVDGPAPSNDELRALQLADTCVGADDAAPTTTTSATAPATSSAIATPPGTSQQGSAQGLAPREPSLHGILGSSVAKTARAIEPLLVALLALAILLLGVASLPREAVPDPRMHDLLARHRVEVVGLGVAALAAVALAFLLS
jgi:hypothetical protein